MTTYKQWEEDNRATLAVEFIQVTPVKWAEYLKHRGYYDGIEDTAKFMRIALQYIEDESSYYGWTIQLWTAANEERQQQ
jgi:hypothetical protein